MYQNFNITKMVFATFKFEIIMMSVLAFFQETLMFSVCITSEAYINWIHNSDQGWQGVWKAFLLLFNILLSVVCRSVLQFYSRMVASRISRCVSSLLYKKILRLSQKSLAVTSTGKLVTLVSGELQTIEKVFWYLPLALVNLIILLFTFVYFIYFYLEGGAIAFF